MIDIAKLRALLTAATEAERACDADPSPGNLGIEAAAEDALELAVCNTLLKCIAAVEREAISDSPAMESIRRAVAQLRKELAK